MVVALCPRVPVASVARVANAGAAFAVVGPVALRGLPGPALMVAATHPPLALFLLDNAVGRAQCVTVDAVVAPAPS